LLDLDKRKTREMTDRSGFKASIVVVAAGTGERLRRTLEAQGQTRAARKAFHRIAGKPLLEWTLSHLSQVSEIDEIVVVLHPEDFADKGLCQRISSWGATALVAGGQRRQDSVINGLNVTTADADRIVGIHDAARPLIHPEDVSELLRVAQGHGAAILGSRVKSTVKKIGEAGNILETLPRQDLWLAGTPQVASREVLIKALEACSDVTDEAMALEQAGIAVKIVENRHPNPKVTTAQDCRLVEFMMAGQGLLPPPKARSMWRVGQGSDIHKLVEGRPLMLGGVEIPFELGALGHSDGDVVLHSLVDALLGAAALGDIGELFPDTDPTHKGAASRIFVEKCMHLVRNQGYEVANADITIHAEKPKLAPWKSALRDSVSAMLQPFQRTPVVVNIKAKTNEGLDAVGRRQAIAAHATVLLVKANRA
jgi:2-C-methyl-D-erythritol 4-phosphate cytidylyltransferase / 2-C-methyl-D-erythritol 2,4-cyclodiphosphate synthase